MDKQTDAEIELSTLRKLLEQKELLLTRAKACLKYYADREGAAICLSEIEKLEAEGVK